MRRNLYYYIYPLKGTIWDWNLGQLGSYLHVFNGRRIVVVASDERTEPFTSVTALLPFSGVEYVHVKNNPQLHETGPFLGILESLRSLDSQEMTFYAHAKGVTKPAYELPSVKRWAWTMYKLNLSHIDLIERLMATYDAVGCFRWDNPPGGSRFLFAGSFFWFKHARLFAGNWRNITKDRYGVENYLGEHLEPKNTFSLTPLYDRNLYKDAPEETETEKWMVELVQKHISNRARM